MCLCLTTIYADLFRIHKIWILFVSTDLRKENSNLLGCKEIKKTLILLADWFDLGWDIEKNTNGINWNVL